MLDGAALLRVEAVEVGGCRLQGILSSLNEKSESSIRVVRTMTSIRLTVEQRLWNANRPVDTR
jgi:hypothetical protein